MQLKTLSPFGLMLALAACSGDGGTSDIRPDASDVAAVEDASADTTPGATDSDHVARDEGVSELDTPSDTLGDDAEADTGGDANEDVGEPPPDPLTASWCYRNQMDPERPGPNYDQFSPLVGSHCLGTNHQDIQGVQKLVFVGDSITTGTPPTLPEDYYRSLLGDAMLERFGEGLIIENYSAFGRRVDDLLMEPHKMLITAFPEVEPLTTLLVFTIGGNDVFAWAEDAANGKPIEEIELEVDAAIQLLADALDYLDDPERFPNGLYVIFTNGYEYTDGTGDTASCPLAAGIGLGEEWEEGRGPVVRFNEAFMRLAVEHGFDLLFLLEHFCGHGFHYDNPESQCYRGPDAEQWLDFTCIHPNPTGHRVLANMFIAVVDE